MVRHEVVQLSDHSRRRRGDGRPRPVEFDFWQPRAGPEPPPLDLSFALDHLLERGRFGLVGAAGFALGGYACAALLGVRIDVPRFAALLAGDLRLAAVPWPSGDGNRAGVPVPESVAADWIAAAGRDHTDDRVQAGFLLAPAIGPLLDPDSLRRVDRPVAVRWGGADTAVVPEQNAVRYATLIPEADGRSVGAGIGHAEFTDGYRSGRAMRALVGSDSATFFQAHLG